MSDVTAALSIPLMAKKKPALLGFLNYHRIDLSKTQKRLAGRYALRPCLDFADVTTTAVIDWLTLGFLLNRSTQFQWIQREISGLVGRTPYVVNTSGGSSASSMCFDVTFQEPEIRVVREAVAAIDAKFGLAMEPVVRAVEISVDFKPRIQTELERAKVARVLMNHLLVKRDVISSFRDRPRTVWGRGEQSTTRLIYDSKHLTLEDNKRFLIETDRDRAPFTDGTFELGAKEAPVRWRVMDKIVDRQNVSAGTFIMLPDKSKRARVEVTLDRPEVEDLGVTYLNDLNDLNFTRLQGRYFRFFLPTFFREADLQHGARSAMTIWRDRERISKFSKTGNVGLKAMDDALAKQNADLRREMLSDMHARRLGLPQADRAGRGLGGTFAAYEELNQRVCVSLRNLGKRVVSGFGDG